MFTSEIDWVQYRLRPIEARDSAAYAQLVAINSAVRPAGAREVININSLTPLTGQHIGQIVVAEAPDGQVVGSGCCAIMPIWFEGRSVIAAHLHSMLVHPAFRKLGVATALTRWRISWARRHYGVSLLIFAEIVQDNIASFRNALKWATDFGQPRESGFLSTTHQPVSPAPGLIIRDAVQSDYPSIIAEINQFNQGINFTRYVTDDNFFCISETEQSETLPHHYVVEQDGELVAGAALYSPNKSTEPDKRHPSPIRKLLANLLGTNPNNNRDYAARVESLWFKPGKVVAANHLIDSFRNRAHLETASLYMTVMNPKIWNALRPFDWWSESSYSVAYFRPQRLRPFEDNPAENAPKMGEMRE